MKLSDYIRGHRKGKEAQRLEKESMKDPFLADAMDGYHQVAGEHIERIEKLRKQVAARSVHAARSTKKKSVYAVTWSIAASLIIGLGISSYFLLLKKGMNEEVFIAKQDSVVQEVSFPEEDLLKEDLPKEEKKEDRIAKSKSVAPPKAQPAAAMPEASKMEEELVVLEDEMETADIKPDKSEVKTTTTNKETLNEVTVVNCSQTKSPVTGRVNSALKQAEKDTIPQSVIGARKYGKYLKENLIRPTDEACAQVKGKVVLTFLVNREGRPYYIKVKQSLCESCDKEAIRLLEEGPDWTYGNQPAEITVKF